LICTDRVTEADTFHPAADASSQSDQQTAPMSVSNEYQFGPAMPPVTASLGTVAAHTLNYTTGILY